MNWNFRSASLPQKAMQRVVLSTECRMLKCSLPTSHHLNRNAAHQGQRHSSPTCPFLPLIATLHMYDLLKQLKRPFPCQCS